MLSGGGTVNLLNQSCCDHQDSNLKTKNKGLMSWSWIKVKTKIKTQNTVSKQDNVSVLYTTERH